MKVQEFCVNALLLLGSIIAIFFVIPVWTPESEGYGVAASTIPDLMCWAIALLCGLQMLHGLQRGLIWGKNPVSLEVVWHLVKYFAVMLLIFPAWKYMGFIPGGMAVLALLYIVTGLKNKAAVAAITVILPLACYALLWYGLHIPTP